MNSAERSYFFPHTGHNYDRNTTFRVQSYFFPHTGNKYDRKGACP